MIDLTIPPKPAIIIPKPAALVRPGDPGFVVPGMIGGLGVNALCGGGGGLSATFSTAFSVTNTTTDNFGTTYTHVQRIAAGSLLATGTVARVTFEASGTQPITINNVFIGLRAGAGDAYDFAATPTRLQFSGSNGVTISTGTQSVTDSGAFTINGATDVLIAFDHNSCSAIASTAGNTPAGTSHYYVAGSDASTVNKSGYTDYTATHGSKAFLKLEVM